MLRGNSVALGDRYRGTDNFQEYFRRITSDGGTIRNEEDNVKIKRGLKSIYGDLKSHRLIYIAGSEQVRTSAPYSYACLLYTSPSPRDKRQYRMPSSA